MDEGAPQLQDLGLLDDALERGGFGCGVRQNGLSLRGQDAGRAALAQGGGAHAQRVGDAAVGQSGVIHRVAQDPEPEMACSSRTNVFAAMKLPG